MSKLKKLIFKNLDSLGLSSKFSEEEKLIFPAGYQKIGDIIILNLDKRLMKKKKEIAIIIQKLFPNAKTIALRKSKIFGKLRKPKLELIYGKETETIHQEGGIKYFLDINHAMFSKGNLFERHRIKKIKKGEIIVDMFAGIGYFSIPFAKQGAKVYAIELAKDSYKYLNKNIKLNKVEKNLISICGDSKKEILNLQKKKIYADIISMGYIPAPITFFGDALKISKDKTLILFHCLLPKKRELEEKELNKLIIILKSKAKKQKFNFNYSKHLVKSFSPGNNHWVLEIILEKIVD